MDSGAKHRFQHPALSRSRQLWIILQLYCPKGLLSIRPHAIRVFASLPQRLLHGKKSHHNKWTRLREIRYTRGCNINCKEHTKHHPKYTLRGRRIRKRCPWNRTRNPLCQEPCQIPSRNHSRQLSRLWWSLRSRSLNNESGWTRCCSAPIQRNNPHSHEHRSSLGAYARFSLMVDSTFRHRIQ